MPRPGYFELAVENVERAAEFYKQAFGWNVHKWEGPMEYYTIQTGEGEPGIDGGLYQAQDGVARTINTLMVEDLDAVVEKINAAGGKILQEKMPIPGVGYFALFMDTEGIMMSLMQNDPEVK